MNPARWFCLLAAVTLVWSCVRYRRWDKAGGDALLFLAWCFMVMGYIDEVVRVFL